MVVSGDHDLPTMFHGKDYEYAFLMQTDYHNTPKDLTGCTIEIELSNIDGPVATLTTSDFLVVDIVTGTILIDIDSVPTSYPVGEMIYKLNITEANSEINQYMEGRIPVRE
jgi:hypothetical protein